MAVIVAMSCGARCLRSARIPRGAWRSIVGNSLPPICSPVNVICRRISTFSGRNWYGGQGHWWSNWALRYVNMRHLAAAATVFFWDRERITNQDVMRCLQGFQDRQALTNQSNNSCESKGDGDLGKGEKEGGGDGGLCVAEQSRDGDSGDVGVGCEGDNDVTITAETLTAANGNGQHRAMNTTTSTHARAVKENNTVSTCSNTEEIYSESIDKSCHPNSQTCVGDVSEQVVGADQGSSQTAAEEVTIDCVVEKEQVKGGDGKNDSGVGKAGVEKMDNSNSNHSEDLKKDGTNQAVLLAGDTTKDNEDEEDESDDPLAGWEFVLQEKTCTVYKKQYEDTGLNQYKVIGGYSDISARDYLEVQVDNEGRRLWDTYVVKLETVDRDQNTGSEIVHWILKYPFPMANREYVFVRRAWISKDEDTIVLINRSVDKHPRVPQNKRCVRVKTYFSEMVIKADTHIDKPGLTYELTYFDNPGTYIPSAAVSWVTNAATPDFLKKIHDAALKRNKVSQEHHQSL